MALTKQNTYQVEITEGDHVQVRIRTLILEDGSVISSTLHRHTISPGQDYSGEIGKVRRCCDVAHIPTVVDKYQKRQDAFAKKDIKDTIKAARAEDNTPETEAAEQAAELALADAEEAAEAAEAAHEAFLLAEG